MNTTYIVELLTIAGNTATINYLFVLRTLCHTVCLKGLNKVYGGCVVILESDIVKAMLTPSKIFTNFFILPKFYNYSIQE